MQTTPTKEKADAGQNSAKILFKVSGQTRRFETGASAGHPFVRHFNTHAEAVRCAHDIDNSRVAEVTVTKSSSYYLRNLAGMPDAQD